MFPCETQSPLSIANDFRNRLIHHYNAFLSESVLILDWGGICEFMIKCCLKPSTNYLTINIKRTVKLISRTVGLQKIVSKWSNIFNEIINLFWY